MIINANNKKYAVPSIPQIGDYRYSAEINCRCDNPDALENMNNWHVDGIYETTQTYVCWTCRRCGDRFYFHLAGMGNDLAKWGMFDEYEIK